MALAIRNLSVLAYANGFTLWHYKAGRDSLASIASDGFFSAAADMLSTGDILMVTSPDGARMLAVSFADPVGVVNTAAFT